MKILVIINPMITMRLSCNFLPELKSSVITAASALMSAASALRSVRRSERVLSLSSELSAYIDDKRGADGRG